MATLRNVDDLTCSSIPSCILHLRANWVALCGIIEIWMKRFDSIVHMNVRLLIPRLGFDATPAYSMHMCRGTALLFIDPTADAI